MGNSAIGRGTAVEENKVKASSADATPDFLDGKVGTTTQVVSNLLEVAVNPATDTVITAADEILFGDVTDSNNVKKDTVQGILDLASSGVTFAMAEFSRAMTTASGTQAITGVGFQPTVVQFIYVQGTQDRAGWAFDRQTTRHTTLASSGTFDGSSSESIIINQGSGNQYVGHITSLDSDGFTITWTRLSAPTGTVTVYYLAFL